MDFLSFFICFEKVIVFCEETAGLCGVFGWKRVENFDFRGIFFKTTIMSGGKYNVPEKNR